MGKSSIKQESIILGSCLLIINIIASFYIRNSNLDMPVMIIIGVALVNRIVALGYVFSIAKKLKNDLAFNTTLLLIFPIIGLFYVKDLSKQQEKHQPLSNDNVGSVNDDAVLNELIERLNAKK